MDNEYGLVFPIILEDGAPVQPGLVDSIESSIRVIIAWAINERNFAANFGTILYSLLGAPNASASKRAIEVFVAQAIANWEQRIRMDKVIVTQDAEFITVDIHAVIRDVETNFNYQIYA